jgi:carbon-monoxide dehydrogenase small subunit
MTERRTVTLRVNGRDHTVAIRSRELLSDVLREHLGLTGTHVGCEHGICGACTVSLDGEPARACIVYGVQAEGRDIRTIEGVRDEPTMRRLSEAFSRHHGLQCGFCTPGFLMLARWALGERPAPDRKRLEDVVSSNVCRCGCYQGIRAAVLEVAAQSSDPRTGGCEVPPA